eukprot:COSAG01_NODE_58165_length_307_cov_3.000000_1_plen_73_part_01
MLAWRARKVFSRVVIQLGLSLRKSEKKHFFQGNGCQRARPQHHGTGAHAAPCPRPAGRTPRHTEAGACRQDLR